MKFSRRGFVTGLAIAGVAGIPAGLYVRQQVLEAEEKELASDEPSVSPPPLNDSLLAGRLIGIWDFRLLEGAADFPEIPNERAELLLDIGPGGRSLTGRLGQRPFKEQTLFNVYGEVVASKLPQLRWKLSDRQGNAYECTATVDHLWGGWSNGGGGATLNGRLHRLGVQPGFSAAQATFVANRLPFIEAREQLTYAPELHRWLISPGQRLYHQLWHASRDKWHRLSDERRQALRGLGWQPGPVKHERDARGKHRHKNGSGEDFLFMHRDMIQRARSLQDLPSWTSLPAPRPYIGHGVDAFVRYVENANGYSVPPTWEIPGDDAFNKWLFDVKSSEGFYGNFQLWEAQYQDPQYLSTLCLAELGSHIELGIHDWLHMCWASIGRDPTSGLPMPGSRSMTDFSERWFRAENDYLGDAFSSHVNPVFWRFHGWIDDRIEDWFLAHEQAHPGEVKRAVVNGVPWFAPGPWVKLAEPWIGPAKEGCGAWLHSNGGGSDIGMLDLETMKLALRLVFSEEEEADRLSKRVSRRPWYGRYLAPGPSSLL
ncbi:twin-arginine translocation signal domain-containing protein [Azomonas macrocytogenes]|uniref:PvdJ/PvdD/PvdP-like protein n=1 Tax=Azomonas macrocytogenes TaxID=69962 RepID=A0A839T8L5_AZOMA|nr:twin-arginine translocation signal domain-containing protein [Azomonas macrocytogenes]MBB3104796.1 hypothetical protein [Azomonas macrocytogenes]